MLGQNCKSIAAWNESLHKCLYVITQKKKFKKFAMRRCLKVFLKKWSKVHRKLVPRLGQQPTMIYAEFSLDGRYDKHIVQG